jgi:ribose transport system ATP-binding protein
MRGIDKIFPGVKALTGALFELRPGEIHALVGENGAGKSTLIKILNGVHQADGGEIVLFGRPVSIESPVAALAHGIATIYQEFTLVKALSVRANLFLGREVLRKGLIDIHHERIKASETLARLGAGIDPDALVSELNVAQQQIVEIARALAADARILVMDEPTAALTPREVEKLFVVLRDLSGRGIGVLFISHRLDEVFEIADRITVMRDGKTVVTKPKAEMDRRALIEYMVGRPLEEEFPKAPAERGEVVIEVRNLYGGPVKDVSFSVRQGEVLGIAGLMGSGRTDLVRLIFGADRKTAGVVLLNGRRVTIASPRDAINHGICLLTEDRKAEGLVLKASARDNFSLPNLPSWSRWGFINRLTESHRFSARAQELQIRMAGPEQQAAFLSGGNQQKLLVARWLETNSRVIIFDEPTRGIDVGAKYEMYRLISRLAAEGKAIIIVSSELPEVLGISDRIMVMRQGRIAGEIGDMASASQEQIMAMAV